MLDYDACPPVAAIEATLALRVTARRAAVASRHLLSSAPLSGRRARRLTRGSAVAPAGTAFKWRVQRGWRPVGALPPSHVPTAAIQAGTTTSALAREVGTAATRRDGVAEREADRTHAPNASLALPQRGVAEHVDSARALAVAPSLVWFARWREMRLMRAVEERRAAPPAGDMLRPVVARVRTTPDSPASSAKAAALRAMPAVEPTTAITQRAEWTPLIAVLRARLAAPPDDDQTPSARRPFAIGSRGEQGVAQRSPEVNAAVRAATIVPLVPSVGVATRAAAQAARYATAHATARALDAVNEALPQRVANQVRQDVAQAVERMAVSRSSATPDIAAPFADDRIVNLLLGRMRALLREEQFRHGQLR